MRGGAKRRAPPYRAEGDADQYVVEAVEQANMEAAALAYAAAGLPVFPLIPRRKEPDCARGFYNATTNPATIRRHWRVTDRNIGIPTGAISGFWVLDVDPGGQEHLQDLEADNGALPPTRTSITPRGGRHLWFRYTELVPSTVSKIAPNVDTRGDGGYVAVVPSTTMDGTYAWSGDPEAGCRAGMAGRPHPAQVVDPRNIPGEYRPSACKVRPYGKAALDGEIAALAAVLPGGRNHALNRAAFVLFHLVAGGELDGGAVEQQLVAACQTNGLIQDDGARSVLATLRSGARAGLQYPRSRSGRFA